MSWFVMAYVTQVSDLSLGQILDELLSAILFYDRPRTENENEREIIGVSRRLYH